MVDPSVVASHELRGRLIGEHPHRFILCNSGPLACYQA